MAETQEQINGNLSKLATNGSMLLQQMGQLIQTLSQIFPIGGATSASATTGASGAPPAQVAGYLAVTLPNGTAVKVPYYNV